MKYLLKVADNHTLIYDLDKQSLFWRGNYRESIDFLHMLIGALDTNEDCQADTFEFAGPDNAPITRPESEAWVRLLFNSLRKGALIPEYPRDFTIIP